MKIKGYEFGTGKPVVCVPVVERTEQAIIEKIRQMTESKVPMIEWRMDWYEKVDDVCTVKALLEKIAPYVENTVLLCTFRSKAQGGEATLDASAYMELNRVAAASGVPDMIDLEFYEVTQQKDTIEELQKSGVYVVCSNHNFTYTPQLDVMEGQLTEMVTAGADFAKLAVMPRNKKDVLCLLEAVLSVREKHPDKHFIAMAMGQDGMISRLIGEWYGSEVTFAAFGKTSAPGQAAYEQVQEILERIEECGR